MVEEELVDVDDDVDDVEVVLVDVDDTVAVVDDDVVDEVELVVQDVVELVELVVDVDVVVVDAPEKIRQPLIQPSLAIVYWSRLTNSSNGLLYSEHIFTSASPLFFPTLHNWQASV